ncbi:MAG: hypothetical protein ACXWUG_14755 [Polyangiales bacterium]
MDDVVTIERVLRSHRYRFTTERELQAGIALVLQNQGVAFTREAVLDEGTIDFLVGSIGVEVKIKGSLPDVTRQVHRYLQSPRVESLLLVTTRAGLARLPAIISGKTVRAFHLVTGAF